MGKKVPFALREQIVCRETGVRLTLFNYYSDRSHKASYRFYKNIQKGNYGLEQGVWEGFSVPKGHVGVSRQRGKGWVS